MDYIKKEGLNLNVFLVKVCMEDTCVIDSVWIDAEMANEYMEDLIMQNQGQGVDFELINADVKGACPICKPALEDYDESRQVCTVCGRRFVGMQGSARVNLTARVKADENDQG